MQCPFCGSADKGQHMGISLRGRGWGCWRNTRHRGKDPARLLSAVLHVNYSQAAALVERGGGHAGTDNDLLTQLNKLRGGTLEPEPVHFQMPKEIKPLESQRHKLHEIFFQYLMEERGYSHEDTMRLCKRFGLYYCLSGTFAYRLIIPIADLEGRLVTWTGRSVSPTAEPRYLTLSWKAGRMQELGLPLAREPITDCLLQEGKLFNEPTKTLVLCEGPLDAIRVDYACRKQYVHATCLFGKAVSDRQIDKLATLSEFYDDCVLLLDSDAELDLLEMSTRLGPLGFRILKLPGAWKDPGEMPMQEIRQLLEE